MTLFLIGTLAVFGLFAADTLAFIWGGIALKILWGWFMTPLFGLPELSTAAAIGVAIVVGFLTHQTPPGDDDHWKRVLTHNFITPAIALFAGWIVKGYL